MECFHKPHEQLIELEDALKTREEKWQQRSVEQLRLIDKILRILESPRGTKPTTTTVATSPPPSPTEDINVVLLAAVEEEDKLALRQSEAVKTKRKADEKEDLSTMLTSKKKEAIL
ncbi:unnamed protein product [Linum trigynum]|uniref:Uncharacterized protein n=1 Tax=Linum trigynum TaxID=586398 RepID=A0AAV2E0W7_9ROSI